MIDDREPSRAEERSLFLRSSSLSSLLFSPVLSLSRLETRERTGRDGRDGRELTARVPQRRGGYFDGVKEVFAAGAFALDRFEDVAESGARLAHAQRGSKNNKVALSASMRTRAPMGSGKLRADACPKGGNVALVAKLSM